MTCQISKWTLSLFLLGTLSAAAACGTPADTEEENDQPVVTVTLVEREGMRPFGASAAATQSTATPATLIFALAGPGGTRIETVDFSAHQVRLAHLGRGTWRIRGDGLDAEGNIGWNANSVVFSVAAGERVPVNLVFEPIQ